MQILNKLPDGADIRVTLDEMVMLNNALNEVCNGGHIEDWEFQTRLAHDLEALRRLLKSISDCLENSN